MNNRGDIASIIFAVVAIFIIGILFFFMNHVVDSMYTGFNEYFNESDKFDNSTAQETLEDIQSAENEVWDYAFLGITLLLFTVLLMTAYSTRISVAFYWIYGVLSLIVLGLGVILSNIWQGMVENPEFATTLTRFPITNTILGTYYPTLVSAVVILMMILLFGKRTTGQ